MRPLFWFMILYVHWSHSSRSSKLERWLLSLPTCLWFCSQIYTFRITPTHRMRDQVSLWKLSSYVVSLPHVSLSFSWVSSSWFLSMWRFWRIRRFSLWFPLQQKGISMLLEFLLMGVHHIGGQRVVALHSNGVHSLPGILALNSHLASQMPDAPLWLWLIFSLVSVSTPFSLSFFLLPFLVFLGLFPVLRPLPSPLPPPSSSSSLVCFVGVMGKWFDSASGVE